MDQKMVVSIDFCGMQRVVTQKNSINMPLVEKTSVADALEFVRDGVRWTIPGPQQAGFRGYSLFPYGDRYLPENIDIARA